MNTFCKLLLGGALALAGLSARAQGLEGIVVENYYTISAADANYLNNTVGVTYPIATGAKVYRIYVDMAPNYKLNTVSGSPVGASNNPLDFTTTTTFWNEDNFGTEVPPQTARFDDGAAFDSYITVGISGRSGGAAGCGANTQQAGVLKTADSNGNLTLCTVYSGWPTSGAGGNADGNAPPATAIPALTYNLGGAMDFTALQADGNSFVVIGDSWATLPNGPGQDAAGTNRVLIAQLTTDGDLSFHINVQLQAPNGTLETYVWNQANPNANPPETLSSFLTYPQVQVPDCNGVPGGPALPGTACNDNNVCTINDIWSPSCVCAGTVQDTDGDGTCDANDGCPNDPNKIAPGICGCGVADTDSDGDGVANCNDNCPNVTGQQGSTCNDNNACTINDVLNNSCVCVGTFQDTDGDGTCNANDGCPNDPNKIAAGQCGCGAADTDSDGDGTANCNDGCPNDPNKIAPGVCGCGVADTDSDGDGTANCNDGCPNDPNKIAPGICGCGVADTDSDGDGTANCNDGCPNDPNKIAPGLCGCGVADTDSDNDGVANCNDNCPNVAGQIGSPCDDGNTQTTGDVLNANCVCQGSTVDCNDNDPCTIDSFNGTNCVHTPGPDADGDGTCDLTDGCPNDPNKIAPGICGCGVADTDSDGDGTANCNDGCPNDPNKIAPGVCGCGVADTDSDDDGVANCNDNCPNVAGQIGSPCDDGNAQTTGDVLNASCVCEGSTVDCNDNDPCTIDSFNGTNCVHTPGPDADGDGTCDLTDGCPNDPNKIAPGICGCGVADTDSDNDGIANCNDNCPNLAGVQGDPCNDFNPNTSGDVITANCVCAGTLTNDCLGVPGGPAQPGTPCDDNNVCTINDVYQANCSCAGTVQDTDGDGTCDANDGCPTDPNKTSPGICGCGAADTDSDGDGTANCNDGCPNDPNKIAPGICGCGVADTDSDNDGVANCNDNCPNVSGQIGSACNDNNPNTIGDVLNANCQCQGTVIGGCTENLTLSIKLDGNPAQTTWQLLDITETTTLASGGPFTAGQANTTVTANICVPAGCYHLRVNDSGNNGISNGGYVLRDAQNRRIIDASVGSFTSVSQINTGVNPNRYFCVPISNLGLLGNACDKTRPRNSPITCNTQPGATSYQFWIYDPHGNVYNRRVVKPTNELLPSTLNTDPVPAGVDLNVRVRAMVNGSYLEFGPACRFRLTGGTREMVEFDGVADISMALYPNPNHDGQVTINLAGLDVPEGTPATINVIDMLGQHVHAEQVAVVEGTLNRNLDLGAKLTPGVYVVNVIVDGQRYTARLVKD